MVNRKLEVVNQEDMLFILANRLDGIRKVLIKHKQLMISIEDRILKVENRLDELELHKH